MTDETERKLVGVVDRADTWLAEERDLAVVDAFNGFYHQLAAVNRALAELEELSRDRDVTALALARTNLEWDLLDGHLAFLAATSRNGAGARRTPALGEAVARMRRMLARGLAFRRDSGTAGELLAQTRRLAERLATDEAVTDDALAKAIDSRKRNRRLRRRDAGGMPCPRFEHCLMSRPTKSVRRGRG